MNKRFHPGLTLLCLGAMIAFPGWSFSQEDLEAEFRKASDYIDQESFARALEVYQRIETRLDSFDNLRRARIFNNMGYCAYRMNNLDQAESYYQRALLINDRYVVCLNNLGALLMNQKRYDEALPYLQKARHIDDKNIKVIINLAVCHLRLKNETQARRYVSEAFDIDEKYTELRLRSKHFSERDIRRLREYVRSEPKKGPGPRP